MTTNLTYEQVAKHISSIQKVQDCPSTNVYLRDKNGKISSKRLSYELTAPLHPKGTCCRNILPLEPKDKHLGLRDVSEKTIDGVNFRVTLKKDSSDRDKYISSDKSFTMFLTSREASNKYSMDKFTIDGVDLRASSDILGYILYEVQMFKNIYLSGRENVNSFIMFMNHFHLEDNKTPCLHYKIKEYDKVTYGYTYLSFMYLNFVQYLNKCYLFLSVS